MADTCIFCGREIKFWQAGQLTCGGVPQKVCGKCGNRYMGLSPRQRAVLALETGRAEGQEQIELFLKETEERQEREDARRSCQEKILMCCGQRMTEVDKVSFLSQTGFIQTHTGPMLMFRCGCCGQMKLFDASFFAYTPSETEEPALPEIPDTAPSTPASGKKPPWEK